MSDLQPRIIELRAELVDPPEITSLSQCRSDIREHSLQVYHALLDSCREAQMSVSQCESSYEWLSRYSSSHIALSELCDLSSLRRATLDKANAAYDDQDIHNESPIKDLIASTIQWRTILADLASTSETRQITIALMRHRALSRTLPLPLQSNVETIIGEPLLDKADSIIAGITTAAARLASRCRFVEQVCELRTLASEIDESAGEIQLILNQLERDMIAYIDTSLWPASEISERENSAWKDELSRIAETLKIVIGPKLILATSRLEEGKEAGWESSAIFPVSNAQHVQQSQSLVDTVQTSLADVETLHDLSRRVCAQTRTVAAVQREADELDLSIRNSQPTGIKDLQDEVSAWEADVVTRVPFLDIYASRHHDPVPIVPSSGVYPDATPRALLTPPPSPQVISAQGSRPPHHRWNLATVDRQVRAEINSLTSRIQSRLDRSKSGAISLPENPDGRLVAAHRPSSIPDVFSLSTQADFPTTPVASSPQATPIRVHRTAFPRTGSTNTRSVSSTLSAARRPPIPSTFKHDRSRSISLGSARPPLQTSKRIPLKYVANDRNQLDKAVGQIVNNLNVSATSQIECSELTMCARYTYQFHPWVSPTKTNGTTSREVIG